jgi:DNA gyrase subunit A
MIISRSGLTIRMPVAKINLLGRATQGVKLVSIREGDAIAAVSVVAHSDEETQAAENQELPPAPETPEENND